MPPVSTATPSSAELAGEIGLERPPCGRRRPRADHGDPIFPVVAAEKAVEPILVILELDRPGAILRVGEDEDDADRARHALEAQLQARRAQPFRSHRETRRSSPPPARAAAASGARAAPSVPGWSQRRIAA